MKTIHYRRISLTVFTTLTLIISFIPANFLLVFQSPSVSAQTANSEALSLVKLGDYYKELNNIPRAIEFYQQGLAIAKANKDQSTAVSILKALSEVYLSQEDYAAAIDVSRQGLALAGEILDSSAEMKFLDYLSRAYYLIADYEQAIKYSQQHLASARTATFSGQFIQNHLTVTRRGKSVSDEAQALMTLGNIYYQKSEYDKAIDYYQQFLSIARSQKQRQGEGQVLGNIGLVYASKGEAAKAIDYFEKDLAIQREFRDRLGESQTLGYLASAYSRLKNYSKAVEYYQQSLLIAREVKYTRGEAINLYNLGLTLALFGKLPEAEKSLRDAIDVHESLRKKLGNNDAYKVSIFEQEAKIYQGLQQVLIGQEKNNEALEVSEWGRARAFVDLLARRLSTNGKGVTTSEPVVDKPTLPLLQKIAKQQNATLVQYSVIGDDKSKLYIWVIKPTGEVTFRESDLESLLQKENTTLAKLVTTSRQSIGVRGGIIASENLNQLKRLHELLIKPIADLLSSNENNRVIFIPQSSLFLVPFPALQDEQGKYLIEKHTILTAPSIQVLDLTRRQRGAETTTSLENALIVGNPIMPKVVLEPGQSPEQLKDLPWAKKEAQDIASLLKTDAITGKQATKAAIVKKMPSARIIHLATHGLLDDNRGLGSAIALAPSGNDNGLLTAEEILNLKLNADLVVLSACDTGRGRITGDGVIGLSRSLISAGVPSVIVSLWAVDDNSTSFLMTEFYKNLQQKLDKATALRKAMLTTMQKYPEPKYWAAFTLIGEY
ncbi:TPR repeat-containing protein [Nostoc commune NIES-4072]|uniref:TPR repeat-containing protein n=1 Tax=Nostoc commune NIES-4072 TaxID=2005467 RepID=A0A2R5G322_NOSCO|nr:CHAT domain-containing tetratricopeptide repeat protein [Nostoc commune]BBD70199.1 TPR repeat-containing protein [Nostoc commune HK-02]GBG22853.1 TPR repeat-containing protein [Nostoc commune NIES-4072]